MKQVAIFMSFWMLCIGLCGILTPILCSYMPLSKASRKWSEEKDQIGILDRFCLGCAGYSIGSGRPVIAVLCVAGFIFCGWQATTLKIGDPTPGTPLLWPEHQYNLDQELVDGTFAASSENFTMFYEGSDKSVYDPVVLKTFEAFSRHMRKELPDIYKSSASIGDMAKMLHTTLRDGDQLWYMLPRNEQMLTGLLAHLRSNADRGTLSRFIDTTAERAQVTMFFSDHTSDNLLRIKKAAYDFFENNPAKIDNGEFLLAGGRIGMEIAVNEEMKRSHVVIDLMVLAAIFMLCSIAFHSFVCGLMLTVPLVLANLVAFAYMALTGIGLSINTLPVAAVGVGVGVDFAIYIYSRCIDEFPKQVGWNETVIAAVRTSGKAVVYTGLTMVLPIMTWYLMSDLKFQAQMGMFLAIIIGVNVILAITLHPLMISSIKPAFIKRGVARRE